MNMNRIICTLILSIFNFIALFTTQILAQQTPSGWYFYEGDTTKVIVKGEGDYNIQLFQTLDPNERIRVVVQFKDTPLLIAKKRSKLSGDIKSIAEKRFDQFRSDLANLGKRGKVKGISDPSIDLKYTYYKVYYGATLDMPRGLIPEVAALDYVYRIYPDKEFSVSLDKSVAHIQADRVWKELGVRGKGVKIGVIDTGIDYRNPNLGGGIGSSFKVKGGIDISNGDSDPIDDNGHGTHVAATVAANGPEFTGVAPEADLYAIKVLSGNGSGLTTDVILGIEWVADPNNDGDFSDKMDIVNMSLGSSLVEVNDPAVIALNNASELDILFVVAAGNRSENRTINSPGTAEKALTVGASNLNDDIASFSSKGPNAHNFHIKPEVVAPGVGIRAPIHNNLVKSLNGTSMATPHVAGIAALIKELRPDISTDDLKSLIINQSIDLGMNIMSQGKGRVDAFEAAKAEMIVSPSVLNMGIIDLDAEVWTRSFTLELKNLSDQSQTYNFSVSEPHSAVNIQSSESVLNVAPGQSSTTELTIKVSNFEIPFPTDLSLTYSGSVSFSSESDTVEVPWAFVKATQLYLITEQPFRSFAIKHINERIIETAFGRLADNFFEQVLLLPRGIYDLTVQIEGENGERAFIIKDSLFVSNVDTLNFSMEDAPYQHNFNYSTPDGGEIDESDVISSSLYYRMPKRATGEAIFEQSNFNRRLFFTSEIPEGFEFGLSELSRNDFQENTFNNLAHYINSSNFTQNNYSINPEDIRQIKTRFHTQLDANIGGIALMDVGVLNFNDYSISFATPAEIISPDEIPAEITLYSNNEFTDNSFQKTFSFTTAETMEIGDFIHNSFYNTRPIFVTENKVGSFSRKSILDVLQSFDQPLEFGMTPIWTSARFINQNRESASIGNFPLQFKGGLNEDYRYLNQNSIAYVYNENEEFLFKYRLGDERKTTVLPSKYDIRIPVQKYRLGNHEGKLKLRSIVDLANPEDPSPPNFNGVLITNPQGSLIDPVIDRINYEGVKVRFGGYDFNEFLLGDGRHDYMTAELPLAKLYYKDSGSLEWKEATAELTYGFDELSQQVYEYTFTDEYLSTDKAVDLKAHLIDAEGNESIYTIEPAFGIGDFKVFTSNDEEPGATLPQRWMLDQNYPNPFNPTTVIRFEAPEATQAEITVFDIVGKQVATILDERITAGVHTVPFNATGLASGMYIYRLKTPEFTKIRKMLLIK